MAAVTSEDPEKIQLAARLMVIESRLDAIEAKLPTTYEGEDKPKKKR